MKMKISVNPFLTFLCPLLLATSLFAPGAAEASRKLSQTVLKASTVHGGVIGSNVCVTADMLNAATYIGPSAVHLAYHAYKFSFRNLSDVPQTIYMRILPGTKIVSKKSSAGGTAGVPDAWGPTREITSTDTRTITLGPYGEGEHDVTFTMTPAGASISPIDSGQDCANPAIEPQVCLALDTTLVVEFEVQQDRGAVLGSAVMEAHRCNGYTDIMRTTPLNKDLNGGRPF